MDASCRSPEKAASEAGKRNRGYPAKAVKRAQVKPRDGPANLNQQRAMVDKSQEHRATGARRRQSAEKRRGRFSQIATVMDKEFCKRELREYRVVSVPVERLLPRAGERDEFCALFDHVGDALFEIAVHDDGSLRLNWFNKTFANAVRLRSPAARGKLVQSVCAFPIASTLTSKLRQCLRSAQPVRFGLSIPDHATIRRWEFGLFPSHDPDRADRILGHARDVTDRREQGERLERSHKLLERMATTTRDILYVLDLVSHRNVYVNQRVYDILGYRSDEIRGMKGDLLTRLIHPEDLPRLIAHYRKFDNLPDGRSLSIEYRVRHAEGRLIWLSSQDTILSRDAGGRPTKILGCAADMSDQRMLLDDTRNLTKQLLYTQEEERRRIARELHDGTAQHLVAVGIGLSYLEMLAGGEGVDRKVVLTIADMKAALAEAQREIRALSYLLHPPALDSLGLVEALRKFIAGFARRTGIRARLAVSDSFSCQSDTIATTLMRIAQEALVNVYRHADAMKVTVKLVMQDGLLVLEVEDDGKGIFAGGFTTCDAIESMGVGIPGMRARVRQFGGELVIIGKSNGTLVRASIPEGASLLG
jgi:PAS domain S-box-containing protein